MTKNQIDYWRLQEEKRSNRAKEAETERSNIAKEVETARSNMAKESIQNMGLLETKRNNIAKETETNRHNLVTEDTEAWRATSQIINETAHTGLDFVVKPAKVVTDLIHGVGSIIPF